MFKPNRGVTPRSAVGRVSSNRMASSPIPIPMPLPHPPAAISATGRRVAGGIAAVAWVALALQLVVSLGILTAAGRTLLDAVWNYLGFFTILTNLLVAITLTRVARGGGFGSAPTHHSTITGVVLAIAIVGVAYHTLLSGRVPVMGPLWWTADRMLHYLMPAATVLWWLVFVPTRTLTYRDPLAWLVFPVGYLVYALVRGAIDGWYPYFFIDVSAIGYGQALANAALLTSAMFVAGCLMVTGARVVAFLRSRR
jgi:hypothetical protein